MAEAMRLPPPFPDELLLGRLIRHVTASGESAGALAKRLFGTARTSIHPFLTAGLTRLAESSREDAQVLFNRQTLAPLFLFYLPNHAERLRALILANNGAKVLRESQLPSFGAGSSLCLKWCPQCAQEDLYEFGVTYWHRSHQIPGVTACFKHPLLLQRVDLQRRQRVIAGLLPASNGYPRTASAVESRVAAFSQNLLTRLWEDLPRIEIATIYQYRLRELGYITSGGRVRRQSLLRRFAVEVEQYRPSPDSSLPRGRQDYRYISELLELGGSHHPFRHLLFGAWLFNSSDDPLDYRPHISEQVATQNDVGKKLALEKWCLKLLREGHPMAEVSRLTGKSRCYLKRLGIQHEVKLTLKPKQLTLELQRKIIHLARAGMHRKVISKRCDIGIGSVEQVISSEPGLVAWRRRCHWESQRRRCRLKITRYQHLHPDAIRKMIKKNCNAEFFWLYRNDRAWLEGVLPEATISVGRKAASEPHTC